MARRMIGGSLFAQLLISDTMPMQCESGRAAPAGCCRSEADSESRARRTSDGADGDDDREGGGGGSPVTVRRANRGCRGDDENGFGGRRRENELATKRRSASDRPSTTSTYQDYNNSCLYQVSYGDGTYTVGDGSYTVGDCISETLTFNDVALVENIAHGCGHNIEGLFVGAAGVYKGVATSQLDELAAETAAAMTTSHPDYASLAARVVVSNLHKNTHVLLCGVGRGRGRGRGDSGSGGGGGRRRRRSDCGFGDTVTSGDGGEGPVSGVRGLPEAGGVALFHTRYDLSRRENVSIGEELFGAKSSADQYVNNSEIVDV
ncbi:hypothetical protein Syun_013719 [Stephania yunnanensis]|uniref:Uncharacterized protein n=1 Tax=Stephania yunnanensis TaxID=152371 RepID=A0AAP0JID8_9MAGN